MPATILDVIRQNNKFTTLPDTGDEVAEVAFGHENGVPENDISVWIVKSKEQYYCALQNEERRLLSAAEALEVFEEPADAPLSRYVTELGFGPFNEDQTNTFLQFVDSIAHIKHHSLQAQSEEESLLRSLPLHAVAKPEPCA